jgi:hypothetical protein
MLFSIGEKQTTSITKPHNEKFKKFKSGDLTVKAFVHRGRFFSPVNVLNGFDYHTNTSQIDRSTKYQTLKKLNKQIWI